MKLFTSRVWIVFRKLVTGDVDISLLSRFKPVPVIITPQAWNVK